MQINEQNYYTPEVNKEYWSYSLYKAFDACEACGLAQSRGQYEREKTKALLFGGYVDAYFSGDLDAFVGEHYDELYTKKGTLYADYQHANKVINAVECQPKMMEYLEGEKQVIKTAELFGVPWKIKMDVLYDREYVDESGVLQEGRIIDFKTVKDFEPIYKEGFGRVSFVEAWGYDIQGAIYQKIEQISSQRAKPLPFYIVAVTKEKVPDIAIIRLPQHVLDTALKVVEAKIDRFDLVKCGEIPPERCGHCEWCKSTKILTEPTIYESEV